MTGKELIANELSCAWDGGITYVEYAADTLLSDLVPEEDRKEALIKRCLEALQDYTTIKNDRLEALLQLAWRAGYQHHAGSLKPEQNMNQQMTTDIAQLLEKA